MRTICAASLPAGLRFAAIAALLALAVACSENGHNRPATQVAARVNGDEITVHQINHALRGQNIPPEKAQAAKRAVLEKLIDQQLAKQQAAERRLDRTPATMLSIEAARNEILARAYLEQVAGALPAPTEDEVKGYYAQNPALFARRQIFGLEEISLPVEAPVPGLRDQAAKAHDLRELAMWLKSRNVEFSESRGVRAAEQIPLEWLPRLQGMKTGDIGLFEAGERLHVVRLAAAETAPVDEATARPRIRQFLSNRRLSEAMAQAVRHMREQSNIEYMGEFSASRQAAGGAPQARAHDAKQPAMSGVEKSVRSLR